MTTGHVPRRGDEIDRGKWRNCARVSPAPVSLTIINDVCTIYAYIENIR